MKWGSIILGTALVASLVFNGYQYNQKINLNKDYTHLETKYVALKSNKKEIVSKSVTQFLSALYTYKNTPDFNKIKYIATPEVQSRMSPAGPGPEVGGAQKTKIDSDLEDVVIFHEPSEDRADLAKVLVKFNQVMKVNGISSKTPNIADIELTYENGKWFISKFSSLQQLENFSGA